MTRNATKLKNVRGVTDIFESRTYVVVTLSVDCTGNISMSMGHSFKLYWFSNYYYEVHFLILLIILQSIVIT